MHHALLLVVSLLSSLTVATPVIRSSLSSSSEQLGPAPSTGWTWANTSVVHCFGDSYSDARARRGVPEGFSQEASGPPWIVALTERYNVSYPIRLHNFAWAGATIDEDLVVPYTSTVQSLKNQVATFHSTESEWDPEKTLFTFYFGINDVGNTYDWTNVSLSDFYQQEIDTYHSLLSELASSGASNFLLLNVPPTDRTPMFIEMGPTSVSAVQSAIHIFNEKLSGMVENFRKNIEKKGGYVGFFDDGEVFATLLDNADTLGLLNSTGYSPYPYNSTDLNTQVLPGYPVSSYFWRNSYHPSWHVHEILAGSIATFLARKR